MRGGSPGPPGRGGRGDPPFPGGRDDREESGPDGFGGRPVPPSRLGGPDLGLFDGRPEFLGAAPGRSCWGVFNEYSLFGELIANPIRQRPLFRLAQVLAQRDK